MYAQQLGFSSSWKMLTRDKGWMKPLCILALVGWIPILGQIVVLGYAYEWARLTAWGVDATPKQHGVDYGKVLATGGRAFLVLLSMSIVIGILFAPFLGGWTDEYLAFMPFSVGSLAWRVADNVDSLLGIGILGLAFGLLVGTVIMACMMRSTLYDSFGAGWRLDRIFQMIRRDAGGFLKVWVVAILGGFVVFAYVLIALLIAGIVVLGGVMSIMRNYGAIMYYGGSDSFIEYLVRNMIASPATFVCLIVIAILAAFAYGVIANAVQLISVNAMGQWFCRFDVARWGLSSDPLPEGVPHRPDSPTAHAGGSSPVRPAEVSSWDDGGAASTGAPVAGDATDGFAASSDSYWDEPIDRTGRPVQTVDTVVSSAVPADASVEVGAAERVPEDDTEAAASRGPILLGPVTHEAEAKTDDLSEDNAEDRGC